MSLTKIPADMLSGGIPKTALHSDAQSVVVQQVYAETKTYSGANASTIPHDDTIPTNTEGTEFLTAAITPTHASNHLLVHGQLMISGNNAPARIGVMIFRDSESTPIFATQHTPSSANDIVTIPFRVRVAAGSVSATTFRVRAGAQSNNTSLNGVNSGRIYGGAAVSCIQIDEIKS